MQQKRLLITGFDPFGGQPVNPSWEAVRRLPNEIGDYTLTKLRIPTVFGAAVQAVLKTAQSVQPDVILSIGQAGGRSAVTPEVVGLNLREAGIPDNAGNQPSARPVVEGAPAAYFATVPVREMVRAINAAGLPGALSYSAGVYVCNDVLYTLLHHFDGTPTRVGFIHVPFLPEQAQNGQPSLTLDQMTRALECAIQAL